MVRTYAWALSGSVVTALGQWAILIVLARQSSAHVVGQYVLGLSIAAPITLFLSLGLRTVVATDHRGRAQAGTYVALRLIMVTLSLAVISGFVIIGGFDSTTSWVVLLVGFAKCVELVADVGFGLLQRSGRMDVVGRILVIKHVMTTLAALLVMLYTGSILWTVGVMAAVGVASLVLLDIPAWKAFAQLSRSAMRLRWVAAEHRSLILTAAPLGLAAGIISLHVNLPRYVLERVHGTAVLGLFGALTQLAIAAGLILIAAGHIALPRLSESLSRGRYEEFLRLQRRLVAVAVGLGLFGIAGAALLGRPVLDMLYGPEYAASAPTFVLLMLWAAVGYIAHVFFLSLAAFQLFRAQLWVYTISLLATGLLALALVPTWNGIGAAWAMIVGSAVQVAGFAVVLRSRMIGLSASAPESHGHMLAGVGSDSG